MTDYFDKDFFKFLTGFLAVIIISLIMVLGTKIYSNEKEINRASTATKSTSP